ncbi:glycosyltransferase [Methylobacterium sp. DB0501]|uniref:glycosyltransferase n=1 Tax=Methylobacterium sp. DB0501 TaxID=2709665 RepID=UPI0013E9E98E|nr:glycosyltransferase [Methylobacterium sp. DB0501]NGM37066.1 glycosyltransferase [Methylobacterium sp. DB0501]
MLTYSFEYKVKNFSDWAYINMWVGNSDRPAHFSFRPDCNRIVFNSFKDGSWATETIVEYEFDPNTRCMIDLTIHKSSASLMINDVLILDVTLDNPIPRSARMHSNLHHIDDESDGLTILDILEGPEDSDICQLRFQGKQYRFREIRAQNTKLVFQNIARFLTVTPLSSSGIIVDMSMTYGLAGVVLKSIFPDRDLLTVSSSLDESRIIQDHFELNRIQAEALTRQDLTRRLRSYGLLGERSHVTATEPLAQNFAILLGYNYFSETEASSNPGEMLLPDRHVAVCSVETKMERSMSFLRTAERESDLQVKFVKTPWILRSQSCDALSGLAPRLDIAVAMYNTSTHIEECVESLLASGREDIHVIVVDDGSTDDSADLVSRRFGDHPRLRLLRKANGGCASARNYGRLASDAAYIAFVDADDFVDADFFPNLLDLAKTSKSEIVQGGFDFYDDTKQIFTESYETVLFKNHSRTPFLDKYCFRAQSHELLTGQPTIWRRIYRRDFLESKQIYFPEHIRAYDDFIFHLISINYARDVLTVDGINYHYRQHPSQDIRQRDERHFYCIEMLRLLLKRSVSEGWNNFHEFCQCIVNTFNWSLDRIREDLVGDFIEGAAELWLAIERCYGLSVFGKLSEADILHADFAKTLNQKRRQASSSRLGYGACYLDTMLMQPPTVDLSRRLSSKYYRA